MLILCGLSVLVAVFAVAVWRTVASDGYGTRPAPRSHHDVDALDNRGMPTKYVALS